MMLDQIEQPSKTNFCASTFFLLHSCSDGTEAAQLQSLRFGSDAAADLEGMGARTAAFLWNPDRRRLHGIFAGSGRRAKQTARDAVYLFEVRACVLRALSRSPRSVREE